MHSRSMRRRPSRLPPANGTPPNVAFPARLEPSSAHDPQSRRVVDSMHCVEDNGAHAETRSPRRLAQPRSCCNCSAISLIS